MQHAHEGSITNTAGGAERRTRPRVGELAWIVARDVNRTVGGGYASMELLRRTFTRRGWMSAADHALLVAVSRLTPGTNILAYCVALGWRSHRAAGSLAALIAGSLPAAALVSLLTATLARVDRFRAVQALLAIGMLIAVYLVVATAWQLVRPYLTGPPRTLAVVIAALAAALVAFGVTPVRILLAAAVVGAAWRVPRAS
jgi:chromate transporter